MTHNLLRHYVQVAVHKFYVAHGLFDLALGLMWRAVTHDLSKFRTVEASHFAEHAPMLRVIPYGSPRYKDVLRRLNAALSRHYGINRHHPEHWRWGVHEMDAVDLCEMLCDWKAATRLSLGGDLIHSIDINEDRFHTGSVMADVFRNTAMFRWGRESTHKKSVFKWVARLFMALSVILPVLLWVLK